MEIECVYCSHIFIFFFILENCQDLYFRQSCLRLLLV